VKRILGCLLILTTIPGLLFADNWDANDDTFDPTIHSVVIEDTSWLGDPSPFVHAELSRTGYTHVNPTNYAGFPPSLQISLMVPLKPGETTPSAGGMLMFDKTQTEELIKALEAGLKSAPKDDLKRIQLRTAFKDADWSLAFATDNEQQFVELRNKTKEKVDTYRFSINASKKLLGAVRHTLTKVEAPKKQ